MSSVGIDFKFNETTLKEIKNLPDKVIYKIARKTLDMTQIHIPKSAIPNHAGTLRKTTMANGVRGHSGDWYLSSTTNYASRVWNLPDKGTNWTTDGTHSKWFEWALKEYKTQIVNSSIEQARKESNL